MKAEITIQCRTKEELLTCLKTITKRASKISKKNLGTRELSFEKYKKGSGQYKAKFIAGFIGEIPAGGFRTEKQNKD